jgi:catechol 2,3-dioxygenase-like lactoylglutathione lyase family enzyme
MGGKASEPSVYSTQLHHVGIVVKDIEKAIEHLEALGIGPFKFDDEHRVFPIAFKGELHGEPAEWVTKVSNARMGDIELELLEPASGPQALRESLEATGEGLHHIGFLTTDLPAVIEKQLELGAKLWTGSFPEDAPNFVYFEPTGVGNLAIEVRTP